MLLHRRPAGQPRFFLLRPPSLLHGTNGTRECGSHHNCGTVHPAICSIYFRLTHGQTYLQLGHCNGLFRKALTAYLICPSYTCVGETLHQTVITLISFPSSSIHHMVQAKCLYYSSYVVYKTLSLNFHETPKDDTFYRCPAQSFSLRAPILFRATIHVPFVLLTQ